MRRILTILLCLAMSSLTALFVSCDVLSSLDEFCPFPSTEHDGVYVVSFYLDGEPTAVGSFTVADGRASGDIQGSNVPTTIEACVSPDGQVGFRLVQGDDGDDIGLAIAIDTGVMEGTYTFGNAELNIEGIVEGSRDNRIDEDSHSDFDGTYDAQFTTAGELVSTAVFEVNNSGLDGTITTTSGDTMPAQGYVTSDGLLVVTGTSGALLDTMAEAHIDQDSFEASGAYRFGDEPGAFTAQRRQP